MSSIKIIILLLFESIFFVVNVLSAQQNEVISRNCSLFSGDKSLIECNELTKQNQTKYSSDALNINSTPFNESHGNNSSLKESHSFEANIDFMENSFKRLNDFQTKLNQNLKPIEWRLTQSFHQMIVSFNISKPCSQSITTITEALKRKEFWPLNFLDSMGKLPSGLMSGVLTSFGDYDQCLAIKKAFPDQTIYGKYCLVRPYTPYPDFKKLQNMRKIDFITEETNDFIKSKSKESLNAMKLLLVINPTKNLYLFHLGVCIPSKCSANDLSTILNKVVYPLTRIPIEVGPKCDIITDSIQMTIYQKVMLIVLMSAVLWVTLCTAFRIVNKVLQQKTRVFEIRQNFRLISIIESFSITEANKRLLSPFNDRIKIVDGLMFFYILWNILNAHYGSIVSTGFVGYKSIRTSFIIRMATEPEYFWLRCTFPKDMIIMLSGIIISFDFFGPKNRSTTVWQYFKFVAQKYYRFLPKMLGPILLLNVLSLIGSGPNWHSGDDVFMNSCRNNIWRNLLFINNIMDEIHTYCNLDSMFLAIIFQLQVLSPILMLSFKYSQRVGYLLNFAIIPIACLISIVPKVMYGLKLIPHEVSELNTIQELRHSFLRIFYSTDQYIYMFVIGLIVGYFLRNTQKFDILMKRRSLRLLIALICYAMSVSAVLWSENFKDINKPQNKLNLSLWYITGKILWAFGNIWLIYDVFSKKKGLIDRLLSTKLFNALTRLSFGYLLTSSMISKYQSLTKKETIGISHWNQIQLLYINLTAFSIFSYLLYVFIEYPFINLLELYANQRKRIQINSNPNLKVKRDIDSSV